MPVRRGYATLITRARAAAPDAQMERRAASHGSWGWSASLASTAIRCSARLCFRLGGIFVEVLKDVVFAGCRSARTWAMIRSIRGAPLLLGARSASRWMCRQWRGCWRRLSNIARRSDTPRRESEPVFAMPEGEGALRSRCGARRWGVRGTAVAASAAPSRRSGVAERARFDAVYTKVWRQRWSGTKRKGCSISRKSHGVDFKDAALIFERPVIEAEDAENYGEKRWRALAAFERIFHGRLHVARPAAPDRQRVEVGEDGKKRYQAILARRAEARERGETETSLTLLSASLTPFLANGPRDDALAKPPSICAWIAMCWNGSGLRGHPL